jgi:hypothetical protein
MPTALLFFVLTTVAMPAAPVAFDGKYTKK